MKVSIIIPVHNQIEFTKKAIESLYQFTDEKDFELIVVDNGSTDGTTEYMFSLKGKQNILYGPPASIENKGWCWGLNYGFKYLSPDSDFVLWANNDILFEKDWLPKMFAHFRPGVGAVGPTSNYVNGRQRVEFNDGSWEEEVQWLIGFFLMFRRGVIDAVGEVDERFHWGGSEEWDYIIRMQQKLGLKCIIARDVYIHHFGSQTIMSTVAKDKEEYAKYCIDAHRVLQKKWGKEFIDKWIGQELTVNRVEQGNSPWPSNCKLGWAIPHTWPSINYNTHLSIFGMRKPNVEVLEAGSGGELDRKREYQVENGMNLGCTHFFIGDGDMLFPEMVLVDLFKLLEEGADVAGGLCYRGYPPYDPVVWHPTEYRMLVPFQDFQFGDIIDAGASGAACLLVKREVFQRLKRPWFYNKLEKVLNDKKEEVLSYQEGDHYFTSNAVKAGFKFRIMTKYDIGHLKEFPVNRDLWLTHGLLSRCGNWGNIIALFKKLGDKKWIDKELNNASTEIDWEMNQRKYEISLLYTYLLGKKVKTVLEIGSQKGGTALLWAKLVEKREGNVYCVDRYFAHPGMVYDKSPLKERIIEIEGNSHAGQTLGRIKGSINGNGVDFLFLDGDHTYAGNKKDFEDYSPLVRKGGWIAFHDILDTEFHRKEKCEVHRFWNEIKGKYNHIEIVDPNDKSWCGIGLMEWK
jgi:glycosyltransferase involved in cell wall biosynthesis